MVVDLFGLCCLLFDGVLVDLGLLLLIELLVVYFVVCCLLSTAFIDLLFA